MTKGIAKGDDRAFNEFYDLYFMRLYRYLLVLARGREETAKDALQESMLRILKHMKPFLEEGALWNWLRMVAKTAYIDLVRRTETLASLELEPMPADEDASTVLHGHLLACLDRLDGAERALIKGKYFEGKSYDDLARERGLTARAVESRLLRSRRQLKAMILERMNDEG